MRKKNETVPCAFQSEGVRCTPPMMRGGCGRNPKVAQKRAAALVKGEKAKC